MAAFVIVIRVATAISKETRQRVVGAGDKRCAENIEAVLIHKN